MAVAKVDFSLKAISPITGDLGITSQTDLVEINPFLFVKIVRARNLFAPNGHNNLDPYVEVRAGEFQGRTFCLRGNSNPEWDQVFALENDQIEKDGTKSVDIFVKDNNAWYDQYLGKISLEIFHIPKRFPTDSALAPKWFVLEDERKRRWGELMMCCWIGNQADEAFHEALHLQLGHVLISARHTLNTCSRIYIMPRVWCLRLNLVQVEGLILEVDDPSESSDIFITATIGNGTGTLASKSAKSNNGNPIWNEKDIFFAVAEPLDQILFLTVEQGTLARCKRLGTCKFPVKNAQTQLEGAPHLKTIDVIQNERFFVGKLSMRVTLDGGYHMFDDDPQYSTDVNPTNNGLWRPNIGVFEMGILNATGLPAMKPDDRTDAYCVAKYGSKWIRSRTVVNSLSPKWNEQYSWKVYDPSTFFVISVFDNSQLHEEYIAAGANDTRIGKVRISLSEMQINTVYNYSYPLVQLQPSGLKKMGEIQLSFKFTCPSRTNLYKKYTMPMLFPQHFNDPLSPAQLYGLRQQTIELVRSNMSKAEPPLRSEVVDYMLDSREIVWSMRRCKADVERIKVFLNCLIGIYTYFDDIRKWKDLVSPIIAHLLLVVLFFLPQSLLPAIFLALIVYMVLQIQIKPKTLSHVDLHLSHVHTASKDELEEEFDPMPSRFEDVILMHRYDRLRVSAGRVVTQMGEFTAAMERLQSLLSCQDSTATMLVMISCLIIGIVALAVPFRFLVVVWFLYFLRHPMFRSPFPPFYENWIRRMPSKLDSMI